MKRWFYLLHRWAGIALCIVMALWFFSGVVMMYVGYPKLTPAERLARLPALDLRNCCVEPGIALAAAGIGGSPEELRLAMVAGAPRYLIRAGRESWTAVDAQRGTRVGRIEAADALAEARAFSDRHEVRLLEVVREDDWTHSRALDAHRPLYRVAVGDEAGTEVYVSSRTGEVVRDSTGVERGWNYVGAWLHWLYMFRGNLFDPAWHDIIVWSSGIGTAMAILGVWIGILRLRVRGVYRKGGSHIPYRESWMRWHHILGLVFSLATILWVFSGLMSVNPGKVTSSRNPPPDMALFAGGKLDIKAFAIGAPEAAAAAAPQLGAIKEMQWHWFGGKPWILAFDGAGLTRIVSGTTRGEVRERFEVEDLAIAAARVMPAHRVTASSVLTAYDNWYLERAAHTMLGHIEKRLPVLRVEFDDPDRTWLHVDPYLGTIHNRIDAPRRLARWSFAALHSWDLVGLIDQRPLWDVLMIVFSIGGFALCVTSVVIGVRRLRKSGRRMVSRFSPRSG